LRAALQANRGGKDQQIAADGNPAASVASMCDNVVYRIQIAACRRKEKMDVLKEPERITLVEGLEVLERHVPTEEAKSRLRQAFIRKAFRQAPLFAFSYDEADIDWMTGSVKIPRKRDRFCPTFSRSEFNAYFFEKGLARARGGERLMASATRTMLAKPRAEVEQKIKERVQLGIQMQDQPKRDFAEAAKFVEDVQKWRSFNLNLIEYCFF
jgi:hypothetical protein